MHLKFSLFRPAALFSDLVNSIILDHCKFFQVTLRFNMFCAPFIVHRCPDCFILFCTTFLLADSWSHMPEHIILYLSLVVLMSAAHSLFCLFVLSANLLHDILAQYILAIASGLPVIAANAGALAELVHQGENGFLFSSGDIGALSKCIATIFTNDNLYHQMKENSLQLIIPHDIKNSVRAFEKYIKAA